MNVYDLTWSHCGNHSPVSSQNCIVNHFLVISEVPVCRERASDVGSIAIILGTHVKQTGIRIV